MNGLEIYKYYAAAVGVSKMALLLGLLIMESGFVVLRCRLAPNFCSQRRLDNSYF